MKKEKKKKFFSTAPSPPNKESPAREANASTEALPSYAGTLRVSCSAWLRSSTRERKSPAQN